MVTAGGIRWFGVRGSRGADAVESPFETSDSTEPVLSTRVRIVLLRSQRRLKACLQRVLLVCSRRSRDPAFAYFCVRDRAGEVDVEVDVEADDEDQVDVEDLGTCAQRGLWARVPKGACHRMPILVTSLLKKVVSAHNIFLWAQTDEDSTEISIIILWIFNTLTWIQ